MRRKIVSIALILLGAFMLAPIAAAQTMAERAAMLSSHLTVTRPEGAGPFPVVVMMHGCGGRRAFLDDYARAVNEAGGAAVIVDSLQPRGIGRFGALTSVCTGARLRGRERAGDLYAMLDWVRAQSWADRERLIIAGWSHGAWTAMDALALRSGEEMQRATGLSDLPTEPLAGVEASFLVYPYVGPPAFAGKRAWRISPPTLAIVGGRDRVVGTRAPLASLDQIRGHGVEIETVLFPNATHAFDEQGTLSPISHYNADYARQAEALLARLVRSVRAD